MRNDLALAALACLALLLPQSGSARSYALRYGLEAGQSWHATQTTYRETSVAGLSQIDRGTARFRYEVSAGAATGDLRLDARMLSQTTSEGESPFDFSVIHFVAQMSPLGVSRGMHFQLGDVEPPPIEGLEPDPVAFRQMLRSVASAWLESVYWLPELPEQPISLGDSFADQRIGDVAGTDPGVAMQIESTTTYTLRKVTGHVAEFGIVLSSTVDAATAQSGIVSSRSAEGEATFDLELGMWKHHETRSEHRASLEGVGPLADRATARSVTTIEMQLGEPPQPDPPVERLGL